MSHKFTCTDKEVDKIVNYYNNGMSCEKISKLFNISNKIDTI